MLKLTLIIALGLVSQVFAGVINQDSKFFSTIGEVSSFEWAPARYKSDFRYDVLYYIPKSLKHAKKAKTILFMHGGGASTMTRQGSLRVATSYMKGTMVRLANELKTIVVVPSANGLNWGGHTSMMITDLNKLMRKELKVDHNNMGLSGHSMGAMGIGRNYFFFADEFSYLLPMAGGIEEWRLTEDNLLKMFNVPYVQLQGVHDHFKEFITRNLTHQNEILCLEDQMGEKSKFELIFYEGNHNHDYNLMRETIARLQKTPRDIFQKKLLGTVYFDNLFRTENDITFHRGSNPRYFWVEIAEAQGEPERLDFTASIEGNVIRLDLVQQPKSIKKLRIRLSKKMLDSSKPVELILNGKSYEKRMMDDCPTKNAVDPEFSFEDYMDVLF